MHTEHLGQTNDDRGFSADRPGNSYPYNAETIMSAFSDQEIAAVVLEKGPGLVEAKVPPKVKKGLGDKILDALFKP